MHKIELVMGAPVRYYPNSFQLTLARNLTFTLTFTRTRTRTLTCTRTRTLTLGLSLPWLGYPN